MPRPQCSPSPPGCVPAPGAGPWHPPNPSMCTPCRDGGHDPAQVTGDGDTLPWGWHTCGVGRHGWALGRRHGRGRCHLPTTKGAWITTACAVHPRPGLTTPSITHQPDPHRVTTGVSTLSHGWERAGASSCPAPDLPGEGLPARGWDGSSRLSGSGRRLSPLQPLISHRSRAGPPALAGRGGSHRLSPGTRGAPTAQPQGAEGWGNVFPKECQSPPLSHPGVWWMGDHGAHSSPGWERVWGRKGLTRGSLLTLSNDLNQTERFCHPSR